MDEWEPGVMLPSLGDDAEAQAGPGSRLGIRDFPPQLTSELVENHIPLLRKLKCWEALTWPHVRLMELTDLKLLNSSNSTSEGAHWAT